MNSKTTWRLFFTAIALFAFIWLFELKRPGPKTGVNALIFPKATPTTITGLEIQTTNFLVRAERTNDTWRLTRPFYPAQSTPIEAFVTAVSALPKRDVINASEVAAQDGKLKAYGLDPPAAVVTLLQGTNRYSLQLGTPTALRDELYASIPGSGEVLLTDISILRAIPPSVNAWRSPMLLSLRDRPYDHIQIRSGPRVVEFERDITNLVWRISKPTPSRANDPLIRQLIQGLENTRVKEFVTDSPTADLERYGLQTPQLELSFALDTNRVTALEFGGSPTNDATSIYVRRLSTTNIVLVGREMFDELNKPARSFHDPHLISFDPNQITLLQMKSATPFSVGLTNGVWMINEPNPMLADAELVRRLLTNFFLLSIDSFAKDIPVEADLKEFGLTTPKLSCAFYTTRTNAAGVTTNTILTQVDFGNATNALMYARRSDETPVYLTDNITYLLPTAAWQLRDRQIYNFAPTNVSAIVLSRAGKTNRTARTPQGWAGADQVRSAALDELALQLGKLRAYNWVGKGTAQMPSHGFDKDGLMLDVEITPGGPLTPAIMFGKPGVRGNINAATYLPGDAEPTLFLFPSALYESLLNAFGGQ